MDDNDTSLSITPPSNGPERADRETLEIRQPLEGDAVSAAGLGDRVVLLARVFAPSPVPTRLVLEWTRDGRVLRTSREIEIVAHEATFRVWDAWGPGTGAVPPGDYRVELRTDWGAVFGVAEIEVLPR